MKKVIALLLAAIMLLGTLAGCAEKEPEGVFYDLTGLDPAATMLTVDGQEVSVEMYLYWVAYTADYLATYYGAYFLDEEGNFKWDEEVSEDLNVREYILMDALNTAKMYMIVEKWSEDHEITLGEEQAAAFKSQMDAVTEQYGGEEELKQHLAETGITVEANERMGRMFYLFNEMVELTKEEGSPFYIEDEELYQVDGITEDTVLADHILFAYPEDETQKETVRRQAEGLVETLLQEPDPRAAFDLAADMFSADGGRATNPDGYLVTADAPFVESFKSTALSLEEKEISGVVESEFGYHIIMRKPLRDYVAEAYMSELVGVAMENAEVVWSEESEQFDVEKFVPAYRSYREELMAAKEAESAADAAGEDAADNAAADNAAG